MIGIKGMDLPKSCTMCPAYWEMNAFGLEIEKCRILDKDLKYTISALCPIDPQCPLVYLGKEDMSWEELVEKVKELKSDLLTINEDYIRYRSFAECWDCLEFGIDNQIVFKYMDEQKVIHTDKSFFQMYQIIKLLVGDQK